MKDFIYITSVILSTILCLYTSTFVAVTVNLDYYGRIHPAGKMRAGQALTSSRCFSVSSVPVDLRDKNNFWPKGIQPFYTKYTHAYGIPVIGSSEVNNKSLQRACYVLMFMLADRYDIRNAFYKFYGRVGIIADSQELRDLPDYSHLNIYWDNRARGLGAQYDNPMSSAGDDNVRCHGHDRFDILLHEISHGVHLIGASFVIPGFERRLQETYANAMHKQLWTGYASTNVMEYWAVGSTYYFNTDPPYVIRKNDKNILIDGRDALRRRDPNLLTLMEEIYPCGNTIVQRCSYKECNSTDFARLKKQSDGVSLLNCAVITDLLVDLEECFRQTCIRDGNAFNFRDGRCEVRYCKTFTYTSNREGFAVYKMLSSSKPRMTLQAERKTKFLRNCAKPDRVNKARCQKPGNIKCGPENTSKRKCGSYGCCWINNECFYPKNDCYDQDITCRSVGIECSSNGYFMLRQCPFTCGVCEYANEINYDEMREFCQDYDLQCSEWSHIGECRKNVQFMKDNCPMSCGFCTEQPRCDIKKDDRIPCSAKSRDHCIMKGCCWRKDGCYMPIGCKDKAIECSYQAFKGECERNPYYMRTVCPVSCGTCGNAYASFLLIGLQLCKDSDFMCTTWKDRGECTKNPNYMNVVCPLSCEKCELGKLF